MKNNEGSIFLISAINKEINFLFDNFLSELEITKTESMYLRLIYNNPGITQYEISKLRKIEKSLVTKYITNLEDKGLIEKKLLDKRKKGLYLIEDGQKAIKFIDDFIPDLQEKFKDIFTNEESKFFNNLLKKLKLRLEEVNERES
ncbi:MULTISPECIES: MarR family winged helix-turn-helix transcriptional regulator [Cetobacterium]|uniref:MarR family winged helix-turn-helix transcriptional regulator n=1 Tax=Cetobacterium TaxID=180162 RepID=UPI001F0525B0|nr:MULTISPECIES: MarR family transcriptional regulator [Cetobacterium]UPO96982.1 MarR family transcriptional regulator [Cetobacterium somerae]